MMFNSVKKKTMKRILIFLLLYMAFVAMSCYEDHSAKDFKIVKAYRDRICRGGNSREDFSI